MSNYAVIWAKDWAKHTVRPREECRHPCTEVLTINQRLEPNKRNGGHHIAMDGSICMVCGADTMDRFTLAEGLKLCMDQHGWDLATSERLYEIAAANEAELMEQPAIPIWCLYAFGWTGSEIVDALNGKQIHPAKMSQEVEQLGANVDWRNRYA